MDLKQLSYFVTVVDEGTISAAAKKLHMTQPPLSTQLKLLEEETGRSGSRMREKWYMSGLPRCSTCPLS